MAVARGGVVAGGSDPGRAFLRATAALPRVILAFLLLALAAPALRAGTFSTAAWTDDATSGIASGQTTWAYHFGSTTAATVNGKSVTGIAAAPVSNDDFDLAAPTPAVFNIDLNTLTSLTGTGSAVIARDFVYSNQSGGVMSVTVKGLTVGSTYTVSFLSVGWEAAGARLLTFASGADSRSVDQGQFGDNNGIRIDYTFTATAATRLITLTPQNASFRFHLYGLALRAEAAPTTVTTTADSGLGSLRWALVNAAERSGADTVTFASALSGQTITLGSEIVINDSAGVTVDASGLPGGIIVSGGNAKRLLSLSSGSVVTLRRLTLTGGTGVGSFDSGRGGAVYVNLATLTLDRCTLRDNTGPTPAVDGGGIYNSSGTVTLTGCTLSGNTTSVRGGALHNNFGTVSLTNCTLSGNTTSTHGGGIFNKGGTLTLTHCTVAGNSATDAASGEGGGIFNDFAINCTLENSIVATNTAGSGFGEQILQDGGTLTRLGANLVSSLVAGTDLFNGATLTGSGTVSTTPPNLAALASNGGPTQTMLPNATSPAINAAVGSTATTDQRGLARPQGVAADIGAVEVATASTFVVQNNADAGPGSLRQTLADAALFSPGANNTITFAPALSGETITLTTGHLTLGSDVTIDATALTGGITISGNSNGDATLDPGESRLFDIPAGVTVVLRRLNLINGMAGGLNGGAIANSGQLTVDQCAISACRSNAFGGGILNFGGTLTLTQSTLSGNAASEDGGGMINAGGGTATLTQSTLSGNSASDEGGGIRNIQSTLTLTQSTLSGNSASFGGGISNTASTLTVTQSTLSGNSASAQGGGIANGGTLTLTQSTLSGNAASSNGGGIYNVAGTLTLTQSTLSGNSASSGGGIFNSGGEVTLSQSTLSGNVASGGGGGIFILSGTATLTLSIVADNTASSDANIRGSFFGSNNLINDYPLLAPLGNYGGPTQTRPPLPGSPALDAGGTDPSPFSTDQRGLSRVVDADGDGTAIVDIGAVELQVRLVTTAADENDGLSVGGVSLREAVADASGGSDIIRFDTGLSGQTLTLGGTHLSLARGPLLIDGSTLPGGITLSGNSNGDETLDPGESRLFDIPAGITVVLRRLNLINGMAGGGDGGAIRSSGQLIVDQCSVSACRASAGGGLATAGGSATVTQSTFSNNFAVVGGGLAFFDSSATLARSTVSSNSATRGGGIFGGSLSYPFVNGTITLAQCTLAGNSAQYGGGISLESGHFTGNLVQSTISGNSASLFGSGIYATHSGVALTRCIVAGNASTSSNISSMVPHGTNNLTNGDPLLAPLGNYGGPTPTMPPLPGSPALDAAAGSTETTDQRGALRVADGDGNGTAEVDIGAVEAIPALVTNANDSGAGSLRAALAASSTDIVLFDPPLSGQTITLTSGQLTPSRGVGIDATRLASGLTISGGSNGDNVLEPGESRLFDIPAGMALALRGLNLINGIADPAMNNATGAGGAIRNSGQLTLDLCAISACRARFGGAINSSGVLTARRSTFQQNTATFGGAIHSAENGVLTVAESTFLMNTAHDRGGAVLQNDADSPPGHPTFTRCTFHGNAAVRGGAVNSFSLTNLTHCTLSGNSASGLGGGGGGVLASATSVVNLTNCVVAGNNGASPDLGIEGTGTYTTAGVNLVGDLTGSGLSAGPTLLTGDPRLAPIADYGGPTLTRALLPTSPARNATTFFVDYSDQRGFPIVGLRDLGAYEAGTLSDFNAFAIETPGAALSPTGDADNDGRSDLLEYATQNDPHASSTGEITPTTTSQNAAGAVTQANVTFPTRVGATDLIYTLQRSTTLGAWTTVATWNATTGVLTQASGVTASRNPATGVVSVADMNVSGEDSAFYRLDVQQAP
jgi:predicted outer membrane repeat protein